jgi:acetyl esterase/lipase
MDKRMFQPLTSFVFVQHRRFWICEAARDLMVSHAIVALGVLIAMPLVMPLESSAEPVPGATSPIEALPASSPYGEAKVMRNISYVAHPTPRQNFDLYLPANKTGEPFPLVVWIHGGAWMMGIKEWDNVKYLVRHGYAIASIDYRFSTEAPFPAQIQDCNSALNFILAHATNYGVSSRRFVVGGGSAGGHLALLLGLARSKRDFGADPSIKPLAILDFFGPDDFTRMQNDLEAIHSEKGLEIFKDAGRKLLGTPVEPSSAKAKLASPITYVSAASPPVLILQGDKDDSVPPAQSRRLQEALDQAGIKNQLITVDAGHDGPLFSTPEIESKVVGFLNEVLEKPVETNAHLPE